MGKYIKTKESADLAFSLFDCINSKLLSKMELVMIIKAGKRNVAELKEIIASKDNLLELSLLADKIEDAATEIDKSSLFNQICYEKFDLAKKSTEYANRIDLKGVHRTEEENRRFGFQQGAMEMLSFILDDYNIKK